jgi:hypothetical protein
MPTTKIIHRRLASHSPFDTGYRYYNSFAPEPKGVIRNRHHLLHPPIRLVAKIPPEAADHWHLVVATLLEDRRSWPVPMS